MKRVLPPQFHNPKQNQPPKTGETIMTIPLPPDNFFATSGKAGKSSSERELNSGD